METVHEIVTDKELDTVWANANFGTMKKRDVVKFGLLKCACDYHQGYTLTQIIIELGLATAKGRLTKKGKRYLWLAFDNDSRI